VWDVVYGFNPAEADEPVEAWCAPFGEETDVLPVRSLEMGLKSWEAKAIHGADVNTFSVVTPGLPLVARRTISVDITRSFGEPLPWPLGGPGVIVCDWIKLRVVARTSCRKQRCLGPEA
jgi:hypothetical protein